MNLKTFFADNFEHSGDICDNNEGTNKLIHVCIKMHLNNFCNPELFEDIEPLPIERLSADCLLTASQSPHHCSSTASSQPAVLPLSSCFSLDLPTKVHLMPQWSLAMNNNGN